jgi:uncharacterized protein (DUF1499 family)
MSKRRFVLCSRFAFLMIGISACATTPAGDEPWIDFASLHPRLAVNQALYCSSDICSATNQYADAPQFDLSAEALAERLVLLEPQSSTRRWPNGDIQVRYVALTPHLKFRDDVDLLIHSLEDGSSELAAYSRSRIGLYDFGANNARLQQLFTRLRTLEDKPS